MTTQASTNSEATAQTGAVLEPDPKRNGELLKLPGSAQVYLVLNGFRRWLPPPLTFQLLFVSNAKITEDPNLGDIPEGRALSSQAVLIKELEEAEIYLFTDGVKMWVPTPDIFNLYQFDWNKLGQFSAAFMDAIPKGPDIEGRA